MARRDDREYREYLREEQRSQRGCIARRMQPDFHHGLLGLLGSSTGGCADDQSLTACKGSAFVTLRAGIQLATMATQPSTPAAPANTSGSVALTPNNRDCSDLVAASAVTNPIPIPIAASRAPSRTIIDRTARAGAPSAMRMPISRVRRLTEYVRTP